MVSAAQSNAKAVAAQYASVASLRAATVGQCQRRKTEATQALTFARECDSLWAVGLGLALYDEAGHVHKLIDEMKVCCSQQDTFLNNPYLPIIEAACEIKVNNPAHAIQTLESTRLYEGAGGFWPR